MLKGDNSINHALELCKKLMGHFSHSWKKNVKQDGDPEKRSNVMTLWISKNIIPIITVMAGMEKMA